MPNILNQPESASATAPQVAPAEMPPTPGLTIVVAVVVVAALYYGRGVLIPITLAVLLSFVLSPLVELLRRAWLGRILSVVVAVILALAIIFTIVTIIGTQVAQLAKNLPQYQTTIEEKATGLRDSIVKRFSRIISGLDHEITRPTVKSLLSTTSAAPQAKQQKPIPVVVTQAPPTPLQIGESLFSPVLSPLETAGIILVVTIFTLLQKEDLRDRAIRLFGTDDLQRATVAMDEAAQRLSRYFLTQLAINTSFGVVVAIGLYFIGVPSPVLWGLVGALLRFIPYIGAWIAAALPIALAAAIASGWSSVIWTTVLYIVTELTMGQAVEPLVYGHSTGLSPLAVIIAAIFWASIWGSIGLIISTPLTLCLVVLGRYFERLEFLDVLLGDRPPLTPVEGFYQRMLADDLDEAEEQAERYLKEQPLSAYYEEVVLKGLQLAANDISRGVLSLAKVVRLKENIKELVSDLDTYDDVPPSAAEKQKTIAGPTADEKAPSKSLSLAGKIVEKSGLAPEWQGETPVLCIAGRGPLDEAASSMLAQLLRKHGLDAQLARYEAVSRASIGSFGIQNAAMVCLSYLDIKGNPAHLRYLLRRLRQRLPHAEFLVGLWPAQDPILRDPHLRQTVGASYYVSTLHEAVEACLAVAHKSTQNPGTKTPIAEASSDNTKRLSSDLQIAPDRVV
ncbi:MAG: AI-2E family transporter [Deltaproteobacteria bacterium]|nr:AI-2E family transporter [Deltaproteobacteria bacterium]